MMQLTSDQIAQFHKLIYDFYQTNRRYFPWRNDISAYKIFVSEIMLQQTQTARVVPKFEQWIEKFPDFAALAQASNHEILSAWQGLGYNRRGLALGKIAQIITQDFAGNPPQQPEILLNFPAIGPNTAGSICAFAFNHPTIFIETNIRTVFTHTFFPKQDNIDDKQLLPLIKQTIDHVSPRDWYYALMDYGVYLKQKLPRINAASKHYTRQTKFIGSKRQIRGAIIKILTELHRIDQDELIEILNFQYPENPHDRTTILQNLIAEQLIFSTENILHL